MMNRKNFLSTFCAVFISMFLLGLAFASYFYFQNYEVTLHSKLDPKTRCIPIINFPEEGDVTEIQNSALAFDEPITDSTELEFSIAYDGSSIAHKPIVVLSYHEPRHSEDQTQCLAEYGKLLKYIRWLTTVPFHVVKCPSDACRHLKTKTFLALDFYDTKRVHSQKLTDGLSYEMYLYNAFNVERDMYIKEEEESEEESQGSGDTHENDQVEVFKREKDLKLFQNKWKI